MPNRIIKDSIRTSKTVNAMTDFQFRVWVYLITYVDDYGRGSADPELIKGFVFPRRKRISESDIENALAELAGMGCISLYDVDGESYFCFPNWGAHQRIQTKKSKFPAPDCERSIVLTVNHGELPPESESESESKSESSLSIPDGIDRCTARQMQPVIDAWNALGLRQIKLGDSTTTRYRQLKARIKSYGLDGVMSAIEKIKTSSFLQGNNTRGWVISFDWFIKLNNFPKVLEGNYDERKQPESLKGCKVPYGSAGQGPLGEFEQAALDRMLERAKEGDAT